MHTVRLISSALPKAWLPVLPSEPQVAICAITGEETLCLPRKEVLGKSFTNQNLLAVPSSEFVGVDVYNSWFAGYKTDPTKKRLKRPERMASWFCDGKQFVELTKPKIREFVFHPPQSGYWSGYVTTSYKKHGSLLTPVNAGDKRVWVFETLLVDCSDLNQVNEWWHRLRKAQDIGFGRTALETCECPGYIIQKHGIRVWTGFRDWAWPKKTSSLYQFLCYLLPSQKEIKDANANDRDSNDS